MPEEEDPFKKVQEELRKMEVGEGEGQEDEIERRFRELDERHADKPDLPSTDEYEQRFQELEAKVGNIKDRRSEEQKREHHRQRTEQADAKGMGVGLTVAYAIVGLPLVGALIGYLIDQQLGMNLWKGVLTLIGAVLGITFTVVTVNKRL